MPASPSLLIVPARFKTGKLYTQIATTSAGLVLGSSGDFNVTRGTTATRFNSAGLIESVASGVPRLDYYTSGGTAGCPALLVEPSAQNFVLNSDNSSTSWTLGAGTASGYVDVIGVSGNTITATASGGIGSNVFLRRTLNTALASGSTYTVSFLMRQTGAHTIGGYWIGIAGVGDIGGGFDVSGSFSSGAIYSAAGATNRIRRVERWGADVYRCSETFTLTASGTLDRILMGPLGAVNNPAITSSGNTMSFAAPQIELGSVPTTFIPATASPVTRNAEVINLTGSVSGCIGQTEGVLYIECESNNGLDDVIFINQLVSDSIVLTKNANNAYIGQIYYSSNPPISFTSASGVTGMVKIAIAYKSGDSTMYLNGSRVGTLNTTAITFGGALSRIGVSKSAFFAGAKPSRIRAIATYTTRLTDTELATLTTL